MVTESSGVKAIYDSPLQLRRPLAGSLIVSNPFSHQSAGISVFALLAYDAHTAVGPTQCAARAMGRVADSVLGAGSREFEDYWGPP